MLDRNEIVRLLDASRDPDERDTLLLPQLSSVRDTAHTLLEACCSGSEDTPEAVEDLIQALRVLRNACAGGEAACSALLTCGCVDLLADVIDALGAGSAALNWVLPAIVAQFAANLCNGGGAACSVAVWQRLFPLRFATLAHVDSLAAQEATALAVFTCCRTVDGAAAALAGPDGGPVVMALLQSNQRLAAQEQCNSDLALLLGYLAFQLDLLQPAFASLLGPEEVSADGGGSAEEALPFTKAHSLLLQELAAEALHAPQRAPPLCGSLSSLSLVEQEGGEESTALSSMRFAVDLMQRLAARGSCAVGAVDEAVGGEGDSAKAQLLQDVLHLMRDVVARDDDGRGLTNATKGGKESEAGAARSLVEELQAAGVVLCLLGMLAALGPVQNPRRPEPAQPMVELAGALKEEAEKYAVQQPYQGYRSDILAVLGNMAHKRPAVQAAVAACGGVELVLAQCQVDDASPLSREWALWAVRNLCEGSEAARDAIIELKAVAALDSEELQKAGVKISLDEGSGKLRVEKREGR